MFKKLILSAVFLLMMTSNVFAAEYIVDCNTGSDDNDGINAPFATIQKAADVVVAGDVVTVKPGLYDGPVNITKKGTADKPIVFRAEKSGKGETVISNADKTFRANANKDLWTVYDEENNIWVTDYTAECNAYVSSEAGKKSMLFPTTLLCNDVDLIPYKSLDNLVKLEYPDEGESDSDGNKIDGTVTTWVGYPQGFYYDAYAEKLYVRLREDEKYTPSNPNECMVKVSSSKYNYVSRTATQAGGGGYRGDAMGRDSFNIMVGVYNENNGYMPDVETRAASYFVEIDGFTLESPGYCGVWLRASDVTVRNCTFVGCRTGVRGAVMVKSTSDGSGTIANTGDCIYSDNVVVEHCDYGRFPVLDDAIDMQYDRYNNPEKYSNLPDTAQGYDVTWQRKDRNKNFNYEMGGIVAYMGKNWVVRNNHIHDCFDAMSLISMVMYYNADGKQIGSQFIEIYGNKFENCLDNAIEFEDHGKDIRVYKNEFRNIFVPISWQPGGGTPWPTNIRFYKNVIYNTRDFNDMLKNYFGFTNYIFKIGANKQNWQTHEWMKEFWDEATQMPNIDCVTATEEGVWFFNNTIYSPGSKLVANVGGSGMSAIPFDNFRMANNAVVCGVASSTEENGSYFAKLSQGVKGLECQANVYSPDYICKYKITDNILDNGGKCLSNPDKMGFKELTRLTFNPEINADSPLIGIGVADRHEKDMSRTVGALEYGEKWQLDYGVIVR